MVRGIAAETLAAARLLAFWIGFGVPLLLAAPLAAALLGMPFDVLWLLVPGLVAGALVLLMVQGALQLVGPLMTRRVIDVAIPSKDSALVVSSTILLLAALVLAGCANIQF
jgi:ABC-type transport system involved in cytochrome c biogenesis permease component